jgi:hypothetical protein
MTAFGTLMPKMPHAGEDHGEASFIGGGNYFVITHGTAGLNDRRCPRLGGCKQSVGEWEESV